MYEWQESRSWRLLGSHLINSLIPLPTGRGRPGSIEMNRQRQMETACPQATLWIYEKVIAFLLLSS